MMKWNNILGLVLLFFAGIILCACKDDDATPAPQVSIVDFDLAINENPASGFVLGTPTASTDRGELEYRIDQQMPAGAIAINATSGQLSVADSSLFDYEINPVISATVHATAEGTSEEASITITLNDLNERVINIVNGLVANFTFDGDVNDSTGNILGAKIVGGVTPAVNRKAEADKAYALDGSGYIEIPDDSLLVNENLGFTFSVWAKADTRNSQQSLFSKAFDYQSLITPATSNLPTGDFYWGIGGDDGDWADSRRLFIDRAFLRGFWHHYTVVWTQTEVNTYIDGNLRSTTTIDIINLKNSGYSLLVGAKEYPSNNTIGNFFVGSIDDFRYYNKPLTAAEVFEVYRR